MRQFSKRELGTFLDRNRVDFKSLDLAGFRAWLSDRIDEASSQQTFVARCHIREIRRRHRKRLRDRERRREQAEGEYETSESFARLQYLTREIRDLERAIAGLSQAVAQNRADPAKLHDFKENKKSLVEEYGELAEASSEKKKFDRAEVSLNRLTEEIGLGDAYAALDALSMKQGNRSSAAGASFEVEASSASQEFIVPNVTSVGETSAMLHGVTLGCARGEIDQVIVVEQDGMDDVEVRAVVEAKKNINDLVHGFRVRQENLAWFVGDATGYDPELYKTQQYPLGEFDSIATHIEDGKEFRFSRRSWKQFMTDNRAEHRLQGLYFVTRERNLTGVSMQELGRILHRVAGDPSFNLESETILRRFRKWALSFVEPMQTEDVLGYYASSDELARHIVFC